MGLGSSSSSRSNSVFVAAKMRKTEACVALLLLTIGDGPPDDEQRATDKSCGTGDPFPPSQVMVTALEKKGSKQTSIDGRSPAGPAAHLWLWRRIASSNADLRVVPLRMPFSVGGLEDGNSQQKDRAATGERIEFLVLTLRFSIGGWSQDGAEVAGQRKLVLRCAGMATSTEGRNSLSQKPLYVRMADTALNIWNSSGPGKEQWNYERGVLLYGIQEVWKKTKDAKYLEFVKNRTDAFVTTNGSIPTYKKSDYNLDNIRSGTVLLFLWKKTGLQKYRVAADTLRDQLRSHPRTLEGGFWHKQAYPYQMWLDGLFMAEPFYAEYAVLFKEPADFDDIALQFILMEKHARDNVTGLLYHGYDESRQQAWADPATGHSPSFWGRAVGWYFMALVDVLDFFPRDHAKRGDLVAILQRLAVAVANVQDAETGVWWEVLDQGGRAGNYRESSASAMFVYGFAKGVANGYLQKDLYKGVYQKGYAGLQAQFVQERVDGGVDFNSTVSVGGLGGDPYRNGTYEYYLSEKVVTNDAKGVGPLLLASLQLLAH